MFNKKNVVFTYMSIGGMLIENYIKGYVGSNTYH